MTQDDEKHEQNLDQCYHDLRDAYRAMTQLKRSISLLYLDELPKNQERLNELRDAYIAQAQYLLDGPRNDEDIGGSFFERGEATA
jgi:hypothetical protein